MVPDHIVSHTSASQFSQTCTHIKMCDIHRQMHKALFNLLQILSYRLLTDNKCMASEGFSVENY